MTHPAPNVQPHEVGQVEQTSCCIAGAGPAGAMLALLLARQGVPVILLESHMDFDRDFRGDTLHPSAMEILDELGLADRLLKLRHTKVSQIHVQTRLGMLDVNLGAGFARLKTKFPYITVMAQSRFLEFITTETKRHPNFRLIMGAHAEELIELDGVVNGLRYRQLDAWHEVRAPLVVATDGRFSRVRKLAGLVPVKTSPSIDVLWFRLSRRDTDAMGALVARVGDGHFLILIDRFDYWQIGSVITKGGYQQVHAAGLPALRQTLAQAMPEFADRVDELQEWQQIAVLSVESSRLTRWHKPGLLLIGDAAHVMSPVGGVGINYAIADAVVASNVLGPKLCAGTPLQERDLAEVQRRRELPTRAIQAFQTLAQGAVMTQLGKTSLNATFEPPFFVRALLKSPTFLTLPAWFIGFGLWAPHVQPLPDHDGNARRTAAST